MLAQKNDIAGIILTHGTDTLAYSAPLLSFLLPDLKVPVCLVSSNRILTDDTANGLINFETAVKLIDSSPEPNVYVAFKNDGESDVNIHLGVRMLEPYSQSDNFYSAEGKLFARNTNGEIEFLNTNIQKTTKTFNFNIDLTNISNPNDHITTSGLYIKPYLGLDYFAFESADVDYVLHDLYHSGTANTREFKMGYHTNFLDFAENCHINQIPLYVCNIRKKDVNYESANLMLEKNVVPIYNMLSNVALAKLMVAYNFLETYDKQNYLNSSICGEIF